MINPAVGMDEEVIQRITLPNGLRVRFQRRPGHLVALQAWVRVGSRDDPPGMGGLAHLLEHALVMGGTRTRSGERLTSLIEEVGGHINAVTGREDLVLYCDIRKEHFNRALSVLGDLLKNAAFRRGIIEKERRAVLSEIRERADWSEAHVADLLYLNSFQKNRARHPAGGTEKSVRGIKREDLVRNYKRHFVAGNMAVYIVGDVSLAEVEKYFGDIPPGSVKRRLFSEPPLGRAKIIRAKGKWDEFNLAVGFRIPPRRHKERFATEIIETILGRGLDSRVVRNIRRRGLAYYTKTFEDGGEDWGLLSIFVTCGGKNVSKILDTLKAITKKRVTVGELKRAKERMTGDLLCLTDSSEGLAIAMRLFEQTYGTTWQEYLKAVEGTTLREVNAAMKKYLKNHVLVLVSPR